MPPGMPGSMGNLPGMGGKKSKGRMAPPARRTKAKSGNPAKRAEQERGITSRPASAPGSAFGVAAPKAPVDVDPADLTLPADLDRFLGGR